MRTLERTLLPIALVTWLCVGAPVFVSALASPRFPLWLAAWLVLGAAIVITRRLFAAALLMQLMAITVMVSTLCNGYEGALLVIIAAHAASKMPRRPGLALVTAQTLLLCTAIALHWSPKPAIMIALPYLGFQLFVFLTVHALRTQQELSSQLLAAQEQLREQSRLEERLVLADDLHDALGHELVAISMQLEIAAHHASGDAQEHIRTARDRTKRALAEVKGIVSALKSPRASDLREALLSLAEGIPRPSVHVAVAEVVTTDDSAEALFRCAQELVTNAVRHADADNVWLDLSEAEGAIQLQARDDGHGVDGSMKIPHSLVDRVRRLGGSVDASSESGRGYNVTIRLPAAS